VRCGYQLLHRGVETTAKGHEHRGHWQHCGLAWLGQPEQRRLVRACSCRCRVVACWGTPCSRSWSWALVASMRLSREKLYSLPSGHEVDGVQWNIVDTAALRERSCRRGGHGLMLALLVLGGRNMADPWQNLAMASMVVVSGRRRRSRAPVARQGRAWAVCVRACVRWSKGRPCANSTGSRRSERGGVMGTRRRSGGARADTVSGSKAGQAGIKTSDKRWG